MAQANKRALLNSFGIEEPDQNMIGASPSNTGVAGGTMPEIDQPTSAPPATMPIEPAAPAAAAQPPAAAAAPDYTKLGQYAGKMGAWSQDANPPGEKFARPWDDRSERYKMMTVLSNFDPTQGITPDVVAALNAANINGAQFSGSGDKLNATNLQNWRNYDGREGIGDIVQGLKSGNGTWQAWSQDGGGGDAAAGPAGMGGLDAQLTGDPTAAIQDALSKLGNSPNLQALLAQLGGAA